MESREEWLQTSRIKDRTKKMWASCERTDENLDNNFSLFQCSLRNLFQECPSGIVNEDTFKLIYAQFFPQGGKKDNVL
jgi:hypothetical protein